MHWKMPGAHWLERPKQTMASTPRAELHTRSLEPHISRPASLFKRASHSRSWPSAFDPSEYAQHTSPDITI